MRQRVFVIRPVLQFDIEFQIVLQARLGQIARARDDAAFVPVAVRESHDVDLRVQVVRGVGSDCRLTGANPLDEFVNAGFNAIRMIGMTDRATDVGSLTAKVGLQVQRTRPLGQ